MSASEKLKALGAAIDEMKISEADRLWLNLQPEINAFRNALPQIVEVVEAAEKAPLRYGGEDYDKAEILEDALAALDEALA